MNKENTITIKLETTPLLDKSEKERKSPQGNALYQRHDAVALLQMIGALNLNRHGIDQMRTYLNLKDKLSEAWRKDKKTLELSFSEAAIIKELLQDPAKKMRAGIGITPFFVETIIPMLEQFKG